MVGEGVTTWHTTIAQGLAYYTSDIGLDEH
jgi:hypothetical protein